MMNKEFWDQRYGEHESVYGAEPNAFLRDFLQDRPVGTALFPAEGEGRNAVYAASLGWKVDAFDQSTVARDKALAKAAATGVELHYTISDLESFEPKGSYDLIGLFYVHMSASIRTAVHRKLVAALKPRGVLVLEGFSKDQLNFNSGGPKEASMLFDMDMLAEDFSEMEEMSMEQALVTLDEGPFHQGPASVIRVVAVRSV
jgi:hypothetical protein